MYKLKGHPEQALVHDIVEPSELWHRRLAHVHYKALPLARKVVEGLLEIQAKHDGVLLRHGNSQATTARDSPQSMFPTSP